MSIPSSIESLPAEAREAFDGWLQDPAITQKEATRRVNALLENMGQGERRLSLQAVNGYDLRRRATAERKRQSRIITEIWADKFGSEPGEQVDQLIIEMLRALTFDIAFRLQNGELDHESLSAVIDAADRVTLMVEQLERSSEIAARREREIKRQADEESKDKNSGESEARRKRRGEVFRFFVREVYGLELDDNFKPLPLPENHGSRKTN